MNDVELIIIWETGEKEVYEFPSVARAEEAMNGMKMAFGNQIAWCGIVKKR